MTVAACDLRPRRLAGVALAGRNRQLRLGEIADSELAISPVLSPSDGFDLSFAGQELARLPHPSPPKSHGRPSVPVPRWNLV